MKPRGEILRPDPRSHGTMCHDSVHDRALSIECRKTKTKVVEMQPIRSDKKITRSR